MHLCTSQKQMPAAHLPKLGDLCLQRQPLGPVLHCIQVNRTLVGCVAEDVVGWLDTWAAENEIPLPPPPVD